jgi:hypothetical protein
MTGSPGRRLPPRLLLLAVLVLAVIWVIRLRDRRPPPQEAERLGLPADWGETLRWVFVRGRDSAVVERDGSELWIRKPFRDRADPILLSEVERQARELKVARFLPDTSLGEFALDPPRAGLLLRSRTGAEWGLALGDSSPVGTEVYVRPLQGRVRVALIDQFTARKYLAPSPEALRDRVPAPLNPGAVDSIKVLAPGHDLAARRVSQDRWISREPRGLPLDPLAIAQVVEFLRSPGIQGFPDRMTPPARLGLAPPRAVWILYQGDRADSVRVGSPTPNQQSVHILPAGRGLPALVGSDCFRSLVDGWPALAQRKLLSVAPESVEAVEFLGDVRGGSFEREGRGWVRLPGRRPAAQPQLLESDLRNLTVLQWRNYPEPPTTPRSRLRLALRLRTEQRAETLMLAAPVDSVAWVRSSPQPRWGVISDQIWRTWRYRLEHE